MRILVLFVSLLIMSINSVIASPLQIHGEEPISADASVIWHSLSLLTQPVDFIDLKQKIESAPRAKATLGGEGAFGLQLTLSNSNSQPSNQMVTLSANYLDQGWGYWQSTNGEVKRILDFSQLNGKSIRQLHKQSFPLSLSAGETGTLWLYVEAKKFPTAINVTFQTDSQFYARLFRDNTLTLSSISVMLTLGMIALFGYIHTKHPITLACAGYVGLHGLGWFAASGAWGYLLPSSGLNPVYFGMMLFPFAAAAASYYTRLLFNCPLRFTRLNQFFHTFSWLCVIIGCISLFIPFSLTFLLAHLIAAVWVPTMVMTGIFMMYKRDFVAKYYLIGSLCYGAALVYYILVHLKQLPFQGSTETLVVTALAIDCFCILLSLTEWLRIQQHRYQETYTQSREDSLTNLGNRLRFNDAIKQLKQQPYFLVFIDCDDLKTINDTHGHDEGDRFLKQASHFMRVQFEDLGQIYRTGGDEFIWLINMEKSQQVDALSAQIKQRVAHVEELIKSTDWPLAGLSFGAATSFECNNFSDCLSLADQRMYQHKRAKKEEKENLEWR